MADVAEPAERKLRYMPAPDPDRFPQPAFRPPVGVGRPARPDHAPRPRRLLPGSRAVAPPAVAALPAPALLPPPAGT